MCDVTEVVQDALDLIEACARGTAGDPANVFLRSMAMRRVLHPLLHEVTYRAVFDRLTDIADDMAEKLNLPGEEDECE
jgi:hypothetical protein